MKNPKEKGGRFERDCCKKLSLWMSEGKREDLFWRSSLSGGRATVQFAKGNVLTNQSGDISAIHPDGHKFTDRFYVEIKHYKDLGYHGMVTDTGPLMEFWHSTVGEANKYRKYPILIAKQNRLPTIVGLGPLSFQFFSIYEGNAIVWRKELHIITFDLFLTTKPGW